MATFLKEAEVAALLAEPKPLPDDYRTRLQIKPKRGHQERELDVSSANGNNFRLILRQSLLNALDFSVILAYLPPQSTARSGCAAITGRATSTPTRLRATLSMISASIAPRSAINSPVCAKMPLRNRPTATRISRSH